MVARRITASLANALAGLLVYFALIFPSEVKQLTPAAFIRIPAEALLGVGLIVLLTGRARRLVAGLAGVTLGLLTVLKIIDIGFQTVLARPFHPVLDWILLDDALSFLSDSIGKLGAIGAAIGV